MYELMGRAHAALVQERGQGTIEYVGLILLLAVLLGGVVAAAKSTGGDTSKIAKAVTDKLKNTIDSIGL